MVDTKKIEIQDPSPQKPPFSARMTQVEVEVKEVVEEMEEEGVVEEVEEEEGDEVVEVVELKVEEVETHRRMVTALLTR